MPSRMNTTEDVDNSKSSEHLRCQCVWHVFSLVPLYTSWTHESSKQSGTQNSSGKQRREKAYSYQTRIDKRIWRIWDELEPMHFSLKECRHFTIYSKFPFIHEFWQKMILFFQTDWGVCLLLHQKATKRRKFVWPFTWAVWTSICWDFVCGKFNSCLMWAGLWSMLIRDDQSSRQNLCTQD